jgi:hypothetical protein
VLPVLDYTLNTTVINEIKWKEFGSFKNPIKIKSWHMSKETEESISQDSQYPGQDENQAPLKHDSTVLLLCQRA